MRDLLLVVVIFGALPMVLMKPKIGVLLYSWLGYMSPHRLTWGFAYNIPFSAIVAAATILGLIFSKEPKRIPWNPVTIVLIIFILWMSLTTALAIDPDAVEQWKKVIKIQLMIFITMMVMVRQDRIHALVWVIVISIGFFGLKGGLFTIISGGQYHVLGPPRSFIAGNTEIGLALLMVLPLMRYLQLNTENKWLRYGLIFTMVMTVVAILGTYSRGALVGAITMSAFMLLKSKKKMLAIILIAISIPITFSILPDQWFERMDTIQADRLDHSAMERIFAWEAGYEIAKARFFGGGFGAFMAESYQAYAPDVVEKAMAYGIPEHLVYQDAHSIYFGILGEHGFVGLGLFIMLGILTWRSATKTVKIAKQYQNLKWAVDLTNMIQISLVGYAAAGAFLSLAYFDLVYHFIAILVIVQLLVKQTLESQRPLDGDGTDFGPKHTERVGVGMRD